MQQYSIGPEDFDNLRLIAQIFSNRSETFAGKVAAESAKRLADSLHSEIARQVAEEIFQAKPNTKRFIRELARYLESEARSSQEGNKEAQEQQLVHA